jgi:hypothetical protein
MRPGHAEALAMVQHEDVQEIAAAALVQYLISGDACTETIRDWLRG